VKYLNQAIDDTRKQEVPNEPLLKKAKYIMLKKTENLTERQKQRFEMIDQANLKTAQAWRMAENFKGLFELSNKEEAIEYFQQWFMNVMGSEINAMKKVAGMFLNHLEGIINYVTCKITNAKTERFNGKIQELRVIAKGYRKFENFRSAILFFNGNLELFHTIPS